MCGIDGFFFNHIIETLQYPITAMMCDITVSIPKLKAFIRYTTVYAYTTLCCN